MTCEECAAARQYSAHRRFDPACLWCGARYFQSLKSVPPPRAMDAGNGRSRPETKDERQAWRAEVLRVWSTYGHDVERMKELAAGETVPLEPAKRGKRNG